ncbi:hypothetical protein IV203_038449 [Nitzschia inconspicua]|uniref:Uncharacterized protein n=1 Tax=Nitzschia inconspicua TaxID=303405 RepID=A0A9K3PZH5_9STRA|nr:hypothetical protein IV203_038449 [Nitzschia inconspicua]
MASPTAPTAATEATAPHYSINTPHIQTVHYLDGRNPTYSPVHDGEIQPFPPSFAMPQAGTAPTPGVMELSRVPNVGVVGTARNRSNYPEKEMKAIDEKRFNCLHVMQHQKALFECEMGRQQYCQHGVHHPYRHGNDGQGASQTKSDIHQQEPYPASVGR